MARGLVRGAGSGVTERRAYLIAGGGGMLGTALQRVLGNHRLRYSAPLEFDFDITDEELIALRVAEFVEALRPGERGVLVNAAAYTNVERAEDEPDNAYLVNETGPRMLADAARRTALDFVHVSTDFVFDGTKTGPYVETDEPHPLSVYGASKLAGERAVLAENPWALIVRTAWVFGPGGNNFPGKILSAARSNPTLRVVTDESGSPTYTLDLATGIVGLVDAQARGVFHLAGSGSCTRFELARETLALAGVSDVTLEPVTSGEFPTKAARPANSVLDCSKASGLGVAMPPWRDALARFVAETEGADA